MGYININSDNYKPFLLQKIKDGYVVKNSTDWGVYIKSFPFDVYPEMKDIPKNDWFDVDGDEEYVPDIPVFKAFTSDIEFIYNGAKDTAMTNVKSFLQYIATYGMNKIYDTYTGIGRTNVRYVKLSDAKLYKNDNGDLLIFKVTFKFNNPTSTITLSL